MNSRRWHGITPVDPFYFVCFCGGVLQRQPSARVGLWMALFALVVLVVDWVETRRLFDRGEGTRGTLVVAAGLTLTILVTWLLLMARPATALGDYFGLLAVFFFLQAVRDAVVLRLSPVELLTRGYANLVAVYLVFGVAAGAVARLEVALVIVGLLVYLVRQWFRWGDALLAWLVADSGS